MREELPKRRSMETLAMILRTGNHAGAHHNREYDVAKGKSRKMKHRKQLDADD